MSRSDPRRVADYLGHILQTIQNDLSPLRAQIAALLPSP